MTPADLIAARKRLGLTQSELGALLGLTDRALRDIEAGRTQRIKPLVAREIERLLAEKQS